jgi:hypothetical protein
MKISNVNDYFNAGQFNPLSSSCQVLFFAGCFETARHLPFSAEMLAF